MGREIRRVAANWEHPKERKFDHRTGQTREEYRPLFASSFDQALADWVRDWNEWKAGGYVKACAEYPAYAKIGMAAAMSAYHGIPPDPAWYAPDWPEAERTHYQLYETVSEGTPLSPPMPSPEALARWLADNHKLWGGESRNLSYDEWLRFCAGDGWAPSMVVTPQGIQSGIEFAANGNNGE